MNGVIASVYVKYVFVSFYASRHHSSGGKVTCEKDQQQSSKSGPTGHISAWQWETKDCDCCSHG